MREILLLLILLMTCADGARSIKAEKDLENLQDWSRDISQQLKQCDERNR